MKIAINIIIVFLLFSFGGNSCSTRNSDELSGKVFYSDDGAIMRFTSLDSCVVENINWNHIFGELANMHEYQEKYNATWSYIDYRSIRIDTGVFVFTVYLSCSLGIIPSSIEHTELIIFIGDPDAMNCYVFKQKENGSCSSMTKTIN